MEILKLKKIDFTTIRLLFFLKDVDIEKVLLSKKISFGVKNYKYFVSYLDNDNKVKPLHLMLSRTSAYVKSYDGQTKWMYFLIEDDNFRIKSVLISKKKLIASLSIINFFWKPK